MRLLIEIVFKEIYRALTEKNYREFLRLVFYFGSVPRYEKKNIKFLNFRFTVPDVLSFIWQFKEIFVDNNYLFRTSSANPIIYDCGANIGTSVLYFKKMFPASKIKAFEAEPEIFNILLDNLAKNNISDVDCINKAVWINDDGVEFSSDGADGSSIYGKRNRVKIPSIRLKNLLEQEDAVDFLKMDIEGAEVEVLLDCGDTLKKAKNIFIEFHSFSKDSQKLDAVLNMLSSNNFRYFIKQEADRKQPFINKMNKNNPEMDMQLNIYAYNNI